LVKRNQDTNSQDYSIPLFHVRFNIDLNVDHVKKVFVNRIRNGIDSEFFWLENSVVYNIDEPEYRSQSWRNVLRHIANGLGMRYDDTCNFSDYIMDEELEEEDFVLFIHALELLHEIFSEFEGKWRTNLENIITSALRQSEIDIGIRWRQGVFWPSGAKSLDNELVNQNLEWLSDRQFVNVLRPFEKGLRHYLEAQDKPERLNDAITDVYESFESMAKIVNENDRDLSANREAFIKRLGINVHYSRMLKEYISYANQYRHGSGDTEPRPIPSEIEVEAFIYSTGLFLRLAKRAIEEKEA